MSTEKLSTSCWQRYFDMSTLYAWTEVRMMQMAPDTADQSKTPKEPNRTRFCLVGSECTRCGHCQFPGGAICPQCLSEALRELPLSPTGKLYSWTVVHVAPHGWDLPYAIGYVDLQEGVRVFSHLGGAPSDFRHDMEVRVEPASIGPKDDRGYPVNFRFVPQTEA